jgi:putative membrane protein
LAKNFFHLSKEEELSPFLHPTEMNQIMNAKNGATQLIANQSAQLTELRKRKILNDFQHMEMERMLIDFYTQQGKNERIKNFPLPRQYATSSLIFTYLFIGLLPLGLTQAFDAMGPWMVFMTIPFTVLVGWVFIIMEIVGDYAENPFEGLAFDIPMTNLCRTIEIDLREMLGEEDLPPPIEPVGNVLL